VTAINHSPPSTTIGAQACPNLYAGNESAIETRSGGMPDDTSEVGHILVVDDDAMVRQTITNFLKEQNVPANSVSCRQDMNSHLEKAHPSLILLDLQLGQENGLDVLREIRSHSNVPIIIISGLSGEEEVHRVVGLELGADDYLAKPFSLRELLARVRAVLRRQERGGATRARDPEMGGYRFNGWSLERLTRRLVNPDGALVSLTNSEYALLLAFLKAPQRPLTREMIVQATRVREDIFDRSIDVQVLRLRRKLEIEPNAPRVIKTERGVGYIFTAMVKPF
jgi:two-component system OmpR family response regulator